jgi:hypothetical protein
VAVVGPRQVGKTTLARRLAAGWPGPTHWFDLEDPQVEAQLAAPLVALGGLGGLVVIDEVQHAPDLFKVLRVLIDRPGTPARFLLLGSASPALLRQSSESLAGRIEVLEAGGFTLDETGATAADTLWWRGGLPRSFTADGDEASRIWRREFIRTAVERDLPQLGMNAAAPAIYRFWSMLAHWHGQVWNAAEPARSLGVNESTVRRYLDWLTQAYFVRQLQPWFANTAKRQVKAPKIYLRDTGLLHELLGVADPAALGRHPKSGASWEGFALDQVLAGELAPRLDANRIVAAGHSYGANTALLAAGARVRRRGSVQSLRDERVRAAMLLSAPPFYGERDIEAILAAVDLPSLHVTATADDIRIPGYWSGVDDRIAVFDAIGGRPKALAVFEGGSHSIFTDRAGTGGLLLNGQVKAATQELSLAFLQRVFGGDEAALQQWPARHAGILARFSAVDA